MKSSLTSTYTKDVKRLSLELHPESVINRKRKNGTQLNTVDIYIRLKYFYLYIFLLAFL